VQYGKVATTRSTLSSDCS